MRHIIGLGFAVLLAAVSVPLPAFSQGAPKMDSSEVEELRGLVAEQRDAGNYKYLRVETDAGESRWVVVMGNAPGEGETAAFRVFGEKENFYSARLDTTFPTLLFVSVLAEAPTI